MTTAGTALTVGATPRQPQLLRRRRRWRMQRRLLPQRQRHRALTLDDLLRPAVRPPQHHALSPADVPA
jgi:hypothetical protein